MKKNLSINLAIIQPLGYVHSLGFVDFARYFRYQFRRLGAEVSISKNRLREDTVNFVFGAHLGFPEEWGHRNPCIFVNLEQLGAGGAQVDPAYLALLERSAVVDCDRANVAAYAREADAVPIFSFGYAAYLEPAEPVPLEQRPIDLLFIGSLNPQRQQFIARVEAAGTKVSLFDHALYGPERDHYVLQSKAVLNCHFYDSNRFEQARAFQCLSLGTPVISQRTASTRPGPVFEDSVIWLSEDAVGDYFSQTFGQPAFYKQARSSLAGFRHGDAAHDPLASFVSMLAYAERSLQEHRQSHPRQVWRPRAIHLGSGKDYKPNWLNLDILDRAMPDLVLDLARPLDLPLEMPTCLGGTVRLEPGAVDQIYANNVLEHVPDLPMLMTNALTLLCEAGEFHIEVPYEKALTAWQDPTHLRAMNENSWIYYTEWFWYLGWFSHRFEVVKAVWLDIGLKPCSQPQAAFMRMVLRKIVTTPQERNTARMMQADFGGLSDDFVAATTPA